MAIRGILKDYETMVELRSTSRKMALKIRFSHGN